MERNILIVDDEPYILSAFQRLLKPHYNSIFTAQTTQEAEKILKVQKIDLVICDQRLPQEDGLHFLTRAKEKWPETLRVLLTGYPDAGLATKALNEASIFRFITKPWDETQVLSLIKKSFEKKDLGFQNQTLLKLTQKQQERLSKLNHELQERTQKVKNSQELIKKNKLRLSKINIFMTHLNESKTLEDIIETIKKDTKNFIPFDGFTLLTHNEKLQKILASFKTKNPRIYSQSKSVIKALFEKPEKVKSILFFPLTTHIGGKKNCSAILSLGRHKPPYFTKKDIETLEEVSGPLAMAINKILLFDIVHRGSKQWEETFDAIEDPITIIDQNFNIIKANKAAEKISGLSIKDLLSKKCYELLAKSSQPCKNCSVPDSLQTKKATTAHDLTEFKGKEMRTWSYPVLNEKNKIEFIVQYYKDLSQEKAIYQKLVQSEKLSAVGLLTSSVAHEINNPVTGILSLTQILKKELNPNDTHYADIVEIERAAERCKEITENLLNFSKELGEWHQSGYQKKLININNVLETTLSLVWFSSEKKSINIEKKFSQSLPLIKAKFGELQQVFFNIFNNAYQAIDKEGTIEITTQKNGPFIEVSIRDTGCGIEPQNIDRIFEPFFTTKKQGKGTGLGLSVSYDIIQKYAGQILVHSKVNSGTTFIVRIK
ncbi:MAG: response regulator [Deltaproteobacteria bacterium]|nr:response regulator [Deltaproteobacteria bacterium]